MYKNDEREEDMCLALREWAADERAEGRAEGRADALALAVNIIRTLRKDSSLSDTAVAERCECTAEEVQAFRNVMKL